MVVVESFDLPEEVAAAALCNEETPVELVVAISVELST